MRHPEDEPEAVQEDCERCGHPMPPGCIGWCADCSGRERISDECICWTTDFSGRSVCGVPCPVHKPRETP